MNARVIGFLLLSLAACSDEMDYDYKMIKDDSIYSTTEHDRQTALIVAEKKLTTYARSACREHISSGWYLSEIKDRGEMNCMETKKGHICRKKNIVLECRKVADFFP